MELRRIPVAFAQSNVEPTYIEKYSSTRIICLDFRNFALDNAMSVPFTLAVVVSAAAANSFDPIAFFSFHGTLMLERPQDLIEP